MAFVPLGTGARCSETGKGGIVLNLDVGQCEILHPEVLTIIHHLFMNPLFPLYPFCPQVAPYSVFSTTTTMVVTQLSFDPCYLLCRTRRVHCWKADDVYRTEHSSAREACTYGPSYQRYLMVSSSPSSPTRCFAPLALSVSLTEPPPPLKYTLL